jgi:hypothetical protein
MLYFGGQRGNLTCPRVPKLWILLLRGWGKMFEGDSADTLTRKFPLVLMRGRAKGLADPKARTSIGASGVFLSVSLFYVASRTLPQRVFLDADQTHKNDENSDKEEKWDRGLIFRVRFFNYMCYELPKRASNLNSALRGSEER